jgi:hypothetical protein
VRTKERVQERMKETMRVRRSARVRAVMAHPESDGADNKSDHVERMSMSE